MTIVADHYQYVIGVDTHSKHHVYALHTNSGAHLESRRFPNTPAGHARAITWTQTRTNHATVLFAVEGAQSYGHTLTEALLAHDLPVAEVRPPTRASRTRHGKNDVFDAQAAARSILTCPIDRIPTPRQGETQNLLRILRQERRSLTRSTTRTKNELVALLRRYNLGVDARTSPGVNLIKQIAAWRQRPTDDPVTAAARAHAKRLAGYWLHYQQDLRTNERALTTLINDIAPTLLEFTGIGPVGAATILDAYSHPGRIHSADAFAALAGAAPVLHQSGNSSHHRLDRTGDRQLNNALHTAIINRRRNDPETLAYYERRTQEGKPKRHIIRALKTKLARRVFKHLEEIFRHPRQPIPCAIQPAHTTPIGHVKPRSETRTAA